MNEKNEAKELSFDMMQFYLEQEKEIKMASLISIILMVALILYILYVAADFTNRF